MNPIYIWRDNLNFLFLWWSTFASIRTNVTLNYVLVLFVFRWIVRKKSLDDVLELVLNGDDSELESFEESRFKLKISMFWQLARWWWTTYKKQRSPSHSTKKSYYVWEEKSFLNIDKIFCELQTATPPRQIQHYMKTFLNL